MRRIPFSFTTVVSGVATGTKNFNPVIDFVDAGDFKKFRIVWETVAAPTGISITQNVQTANSAQSPDTVGADPGSQTATTANGVTTTALLDVSATTASKQLVRPGLNVANSGSTAQLSCRVAGYVEYDDK